MKWLRENPFVAALVAVTVVAVGALGYFLSQFMGEYSAASEEYVTSVQTLQGLQNRAPFPNQENLQKTKELEDQYRAALNAMWQNLAKMNVPIDPSVQPQQFQDDLRKAVNEVKAKAQTNNVTLPQGFYLGFNQFENSPPDAASAPALARQLKIIDQLVTRLIDLKVQSIDDLKLNEDKAPGSNAGPANNRQANNQGGLQKFPFSISFTADQGKFRVAFNSLLSAEEFLIVRSLSLQNTNPAGPPVAAGNSANNSAPTTPEGQGTPGKNDLNVILGREFVKVALHLELVDFPPAPAAPKQ